MMINVAIPQDLTRYDLLRKANYPFAITFETFTKSVIRIQNATGYSFQETLGFIEDELHLRSDLNMFSGGDNPKTLRINTLDPDVIALYENTHSKSRTAINLLILMLTMSHTYESASVSRFIHKLNQLARQLEGENPVRAKPSVSKPAQLKKQVTKLPKKTVKETVEEPAKVFSISKTVDIDHALEDRPSVSAGQSIEKIDRLLDQVSNLRTKQQETLPETGTVVTTSDALSSFIEL